MKTEDKSESRFLGPDEPFFLVSSRRSSSKSAAQKKASSAVTPVVQSRVVVTPLGHELVDVEWCEEITVVTPREKAAELRRLSDVSARAEASLQRVLAAQLRARVTKPSMKRACENEKIPDVDPVIEVITAGKQ